MADDTTQTAAQANPAVLSSTEVEACHVHFKTKLLTVVKSALADEDKIDLIDAAIKESKLYNNSFYTQVKLQVAAGNIGNVSLDDLVILAAAADLISVTDDGILSFN